MPRKKRASGGLKIPCSKKVSSAQIPFDSYASHSDYLSGFQTCITYTLFLFNVFSLSFCILSSHPLVYVSSTFTFLTAFPTFCLFLLLFSLSRVMSRPRLFFHARLKKCHSQFFSFS
jgi:hypothetical protein